MMPQDASRFRALRNLVLSLSHFKKAEQMPADNTLPEIASNPHILRWIGIIVIAAPGYTVATVGMKFAALGSYPVGMVLILAGFILATVAEVFLLRRGDLTVVYVTIIGIETLMILGAAVMLGEIVDLRRMMGAGCVVVGIALCST